MAMEVIIPALGLIVEKVKILRWFKSEGNAVEKGEPLLEIESDKVVTEIVSPTSGFIGAVLYGVEVEVPVGKVVGVIVSQGEEVPTSYRQQVEAVELTKTSMAMPLPASAAKSLGSIKVVPAARNLAEEKGVDLSLIAPTGPHGTIMKKDVEAYLASAIVAGGQQNISSVARKVAEEFQLPLDKIQGTGTRGRIMKVDVLKAAKQPDIVLEEGGLFGKTIPMNKMRQIISERMCKSAFTAPHIYFFSEVNMEKVMSLRELISESVEKRFNARLSINDFLIKAVALAIREYPLLNGMVKDGKIYVHPEINVGLAVALNDGLIVPAIPEADKLSLGSIAQARIDLVDRARNGKLTLDDIERGTFTISSLAQFDVTFFTAILNPPQSGILSVGKIQDQLYLENGQVRTRRISHFGLSVDHRIIDGAVAAAFLQTIKKKMESPNFIF